MFYCIDVFCFDLFVVVLGCMGVCCVQLDQVGVQVIDSCFEVVLSDVVQCCIVQGNLCQLLVCFGVMVVQGVLLVFLVFDEGLWVGIEGQLVMDDFCLFGWWWLGIEVYVEVEMVEQLWVQFVFFWVYCVDQYEMCWMLVGNVIVFDQVDVVGGDVE